MRKRFIVPACVLAVAALGSIVYAVGHPELSFPWSIRITHILYGLYVDAVALLFVLAFWKRASWMHALTLLFELGAIFFLVQSILSVFPEGKVNWYLPLALGLNCVALLFNLTAIRQRKRNMTENREAKQ